MTEHGTNVSFVFIIGLIWAWKLCQSMHLRFVMTGTTISTEWVGVWNVYTQSVNILSSTIIINLRPSKQKLVHEIL